MEYKPGEFLETLVKFIQESLKENDNIEVSKDVRLQSIDGDLRQFDVVITSTINTLPIRIVIECKDKSRKTSVNEIEAFNSKCESIKGIHRKIFVSKKGFSKIAVNRANRFEIELYQLKELDSKIVNEWSEKSGLREITASVSVNNISIGFRYNCIPENINNRDFILYNEDNNDIKIIFNEFICIYINAHLKDLHQKAIGIYTDYKNKNVGDRLTMLSMEVGIDTKKDKLYLIESNKKYYIEDILSNIVFNFKEQNIIPDSSNSYVKHSTQNSQVELMTFHEILGDKRVIMTRNNAEKNHTKMFVTLNDGKPIPVDKMPVFYIPEGLEVTIKEPK